MSTADNTTEQELDENAIIAQRRAKLAELRQHGNAFPNNFKRDTLLAELHQQYDTLDHDQLDNKKIPVKVAGRIMTRRLMGKASFVHLQDMSGRMQLYLRKEALPDGVYEKFKHWDLGDIVAAEGVLFKTKTGELSIKVHQLQLLVKSLRPLPDKFHGLADHEKRYRQRYLDILVNENTRKVFLARTRMIDFIRAFFNQHGFLEVETPMMQSLPGGASARPFETHHHALDMQLFLRIAPELFLKRLVVGGFEKVFEINRNFRNEGLSTKHNPEFTMLEFYQAYADYNDIMDFTEQLLRGLVEHILGDTTLTYQGVSCDFAKPFTRMTMKEAVLHYNSNIKAADLDSMATIKKIATQCGIEVRDEWGLGKLQLEIFEKTVEAELSQPTFITAYPTEVSPLARKNDQDPNITDRFEFFVCGKEIANGFSELNDPEDQAERFREQVNKREHGHDEAMHYDADYIVALEHGMPPAAGEGIGIDRLAMLLTDSPSIRDVILFPLLRSQ